MFLNKLETLIVIVTATLIRPVNKNIRPILSGDEDKLFKYCPKDTSEKVN